MVPPRWLLVSCQPWLDHVLAYPSFFHQTSLLALCSSPPPSLSSHFTIINSQVHPPSHHRPSPFAARTTLLVYRRFCTFQSNGIDSVHHPIQVSAFKWAVVKPVPAGLCSFRNKSTTTPYFAQQPHPATITPYSIAVQSTKQYHHQQRHCICLSSLSPVFSNHTISLIKSKQQQVSCCWTPAKHLL
jgi:hypothetical protein